MAFTPAAITAYAAIAGATATVYAASQKPNAPKMPQAPLLPNLPNKKDLVGGNRQADLMAKSAGGSILSDPKANAGVTDGANATRKTLLGT